MGTAKFNFMEDDSNGFVTVATVGDIPEGEGRTVQLDKRPIALFLYRGKYLAIDDLCPHQGASLSAGSIDCFDEENCNDPKTDSKTEGESQAEGPTVSCPWHAWRFRLSDGKWADNPRLGVDTFETRIVGKEIQIRPTLAD